MVLEWIESVVDDIAFQYGQILVEYLREIDGLVVASTLESTEYRCGICQMPSPLGVLVLDDKDGQNTRLGELGDLLLGVRVHFGERIREPKVVQVGTYLRAVRTRFVLIQM